jgi:predicted adenylyl cyclase CyaB
MKHVNYEFKARLRDEEHVRAALKKLRARHIGNDHQIDTYFRVPRGRLKVREGRIENALIFYRRSDSPRPRRAQIEMMLLPRRNSLRSILAAGLGVLTVVDKRREIYLVGNVKIHLDRVRGLGKFIEVEAVSRSRGVARIRAQARKFQKILGIPSADVLAKSYSDMVLTRSRH